jgi:predicted nucleotidyltransferase
VKSDLTIERKACAAWARNRSEISRVYFFGSRVWGSPREDSDLDIMLVVNNGAFICDKEEWVAELGQKIGQRVHVVAWFGVKDELRETVRSNGLLVFSRNGNDTDFDVEDLDDIDPSAT